MPTADRGATRPRRRYAKRLQPAERREQLLDAARELVVESGFGEVTVAAVAERGGVTRPVLYDSFGSRDELLCELIEREGARLREAMERALADGAPQATLLDALGRFLTDVRAVPDSWRLVYAPIEGVSPVLRERLERARDELRIPLRHLLAAWLTARPGDDLTARVEMDVLVEVVQGAVEAIMRPLLDRPGEFAVSRVLALLDLLLGDID